MRKFGLFSVLSLALAAQVRVTPDLIRLPGELRSALEREDFSAATDLAVKLDTEVQERYRTWLIRDAAERVEETLSWLPPDTETFWFNQQPFTVKPDERPDLVAGRANLIYATDRIAALDHGSFWRRLEGRTIRLVASGARGIDSNVQLSHAMIPAIIGKTDVVYFYYFAEPVDESVFPPSDLSSNGRPFWRAAAMIAKFDAPFTPGVPRPEEEDVSWLSLARPDLVVLASRKESLDMVLTGIATGSRTRALPASLPEWRQVDRNATFWGLCHSRGSNAERAAMAFDAPGQSLDVYRFTDAPIGEAARDRILSQQFKVELQQPGVWHLVADIGERGDFPFHYAMTLLGLGEYR